MNEFKKNKIICLMGPTASGKTKLAMMLYKNLPIEIISVDSALIYRGMNIGTAKPTSQELADYPHRLINIRDVTEIYSVADFYHEVLIEIKKTFKIGRIPLLVGGTMLYFKSLLEGLSFLPSANLNIRNKIKTIAQKKGWRALHNMLSDIDPLAAKSIHFNDTQRISRALEVFLISGKNFTELKTNKFRSLPYDFWQFALIPNDRIVLNQRIVSRFKNMLALGFEQEVYNFFNKKDLHQDLPAMRCIGYRQMWSYLSGKITYENMVHQGIFATKQFAKRQLTWLRHWKNVYYLDNDNINKNYAILVKILNQK